MIKLVTAPPGGGKSFYAIRAVVNALDEGKVVATNVELEPGWATVINKHNLVRRCLRRLRYRSFVAEAEASYFFSEDLSRLFNVRLEGKGEGRGLMVLDEAHNWMNARSWSSSDRDEIVKFFTQHRKLGWDVLLIAQDADMLDKQVRRNFEYHVHLRNLKKARYFISPPVNLFLAITKWHANTKVVTKREFFPLSWRKDLYDTNATFGGLLNGEDASAHLWLPCPPDERPPDAEDARSAAERPPDASPPDSADWDAETGSPRDLESFDLADLDPS